MSHHLSRPRQLLPSFPTKYIAISFYRDISVKAYITNTRFIVSSTCFDRIKIAYNHKKINKLRLSHKWKLNRIITTDDITVRIRGKTASNPDKIDTTSSF